MKVLLHLEIVFEVLGLAFAFEDLLESPWLNWIKESPTLETCLHISPIGANTEPHDFGPLKVMDNEMTAL